MSTEEEAGVADRAPNRDANIADGARKRAAIETYTRHQGALRRTAQRYSLCDADADDALQRGLEILLTKAPTTDPRQLIRWTQTVVKHEALAVRQDRERTLAGPAAAPAEPGGEDWVALLPAGGAGPAERVERREAIARSREALQALKPQELRALTLLAQGYSYAEIGEITGFSHTKINRCLAEGRERFRRIVAGSEDGTRCEELRPLLSAYCDGEAGERAGELREHLRACAHCRAALRTYRAAPAAAAALAPALPLHRSLFERAQEAISGLAARFGGGETEAAVSQTVATGAGGAGVAALGKAAAVCLGTVGGAAACVASGALPAPLAIGGEQRPAAIERPAAAPAQPASQEEPEVEYEPEAPAAEPEPAPAAAAEPPQAPAEAAPPDPAPAPPPPAESGAIEYTPPPPPPPAPPAAAPSSASAGSPAGEFGP